MFEQYWNSLKLAKSLLVIFLQLDGFLKVMSEKLHIAPVKDVHDGIETRDLLVEC